MDVINSPPFYLGNRLTIQIGPCLLRGFSSFRWPIWICVPSQVLAIVDFTSTSNHPSSTQQPEDVNGFAIPGYHPKIQQPRCNTEMQLQHLPYQTSISFDKVLSPSIILNTFLPFQPQQLRTKIPWGSTW